jgi:hypothetical protein
MSFYDEMQEIASEVIDEFKQGSIQYVRMTPGNGPPDDPGPAVPKTYELSAVARGVSYKYVDKSTIVATDLQLVMKVRPDVTPDMLGFIVMDGVKCKIVSVMNIPPAGVTVAHRIIFRK